MGRKLRGGAMQCGLVNVYFRTKWCLRPSSRLAIIDMNRKLGAVPLLGRTCDPIQYNVTWAEVYLHTKWHLDTSSSLATTDIDQKLWVVSPLGEGELDTHLTQCRLG